MALAMPRTPTGRGLVGARTTLGLLTLLAPQTAGRVFLLDPEGNPQLPYLGRMWGIRNLSLAAGLAGSGGADRRRWWQLNVVVDLVDAAAGVVAWRRGELGTPAGVLVTATALLAVGL